jgi:hypothetical protein
VQSAYHFEKGMVESCKGCSSNMEASSLIWKKVWNVKCPRVVKSFLWKACNNILPTKGKLHKRGVTQEPMCPICGMEPETMGHSLWMCSSARYVWLECPPRIQKCASDDDTLYYEVTR